MLGACRQTPMARVVTIGLTTVMTTVVTSIVASIDTYIATIDPSTRQRT